MGQEPNWVEDYSSPNWVEDTPEQSWGDWLVEQGLRTVPAVAGGFIGGALGAPEGGIGAVPGSMLGGGAGSAFGNWMGDLYSGKTSSPLEYAVATAAGAVPGFMGAAEAPANYGLRALGKYALESGGRGLVEGAATNLAMTPFEEYADTGSFIPSGRRMAGAAASGAGFGLVAGAGMGAVHGASHQGRFHVPEMGVMHDQPQPAYYPTKQNYYDQAPTPPQTMDPEWMNPDYADPKNPTFYGDVRNPIYGQQDLGLGNEQPGFDLGPYRAPNGRMTTTGPGREPRFMGPDPQPPPEVLPTQQPFDYTGQGDLFGGNPPPGVPPLSREDLMRQGWTKSPSGALVFPNDTPPPPNEPPAGGAGVVAPPPPAAPPVTQAQGWQPVITHEGQVAVLPPGYGANDVSMLRQQGFISIQGARSPEGYPIMYKGDAAVQAAIAQRRGNRPATAPPPVVRPDVPGAIGPGQVAAGDVVPIPNEKASNLGFVRRMEEGGYVVSHKDATTTYFVRAPEDEGPAFQRVFGDEGNPVQPGETTGRVAPFGAVEKPIPYVDPLSKRDWPTQPNIPTRGSFASFLINKGILPDQLPTLPPEVQTQLRTEYEAGLSAMNVSSPEPPPAPPMRGPQMDPRMAARVEQGGQTVFDATQPPPQQGQLMPMEVGPQEQGMSDKDMLNLRAQQVLHENWGGREPQQQSMIPMFQDAEASELMRRMGIDTSGRHGMPPADEGPSFSKVRPENLFKGSEGKGLGKADFETQWKQSIREAEHLGIDWKKYDNLDELQWDITRKTAQEAVRTGRNPLDGIDEGPSFARVPGGGYKASMNTERGIENITRDYTSPLPAVMNREGVQNAMDAAEKMGSDGVVKVRFNSASKTIEIYDNGNGMDDATIGNKLFEAFSSGKEGEEGATGGKGIGSAAYIYGGEHFQIETIAVDRNPDGKKYRIETSGTPKQHMMGTPESFSRTQVPDETPTGTTIKITLRDDQSIYSAQNMMDKIKDHSRNRSSRLVVDEYGDTSGPLSEIEKVIHPKHGNMDNLTDSRFTSSNDDKMIGDFTTTNRNSQVKVLIPQGPTVAQSYITVHFLNNGMYQFSDDIPMGNIGEVPKNVIVDIHPLTDDLDELYPFINTREDVKKDIREEVTQFVTDSIGAPAVSQRRNRTQELYDKMSSHGVSTAVSGTKRNPLLFDPGDRLTPQERSSLVNNPAVKGLIRVFDKIQDDILNAVGRVKWSDRLEGVGIFLDPGSYGMHIPNPTTKRSSIGINPFIRIEAGQSAKDVAWHTTITNLHEGAHIGTEGGQDINLTPQDMADPRLGPWFQSYIDEMTRHGDIDYQNTGHGVGFTHRLGEVYAKFGVARTYEAAAQIEHALTGGSQSGSYSPEIQRALQLYTESRGRDAVTEDLLSRTGVKSTDRGGLRSEGISGNTEADRNGAIAEVDAHFNKTNDHPIVAAFRGGMKKVDSINDAHFILPDGELVNHGTHTHSQGAKDVGANLWDALQNGVVRFNGNGAEAGSRITYAQAEHIANALDDSIDPHSGRGNIWVDAMLPSGKRDTKQFDERASAESIRNWVNSHYMAEDVPRFSRVKPEGQMPPAPPGKEANDASTWRRIKENAGWGQGNTPKPEAKKKAEISYLHEILALPSGATTTMDFSAPGRNGLTMVLTPQFWKATGAMFKGLSKEGFDVLDKDLRSKPIFQKKIDMETGAVGKSTAEEAGMKLYRMASDAPLSERAQTQLVDGWKRVVVSRTRSAGYRKSIGVPVRMTNRAYITFLNHLNANRFEYLMNKSRNMAIQGLDTGKVRQGMMPWKTSISPDKAMELNPYTNLKLARHIADFVNTATGHGPLKTHLYPHRTGEVSLEESAGALSKFLFSQGQLASRIRMLNPNTYIMATPFVRKQYMKAALSQAAAWAAFATMAKMAGGEVGTEGTSADFGKIKIGDTRIDPGSGFLQFMVLFDRMYQGGYTSSKTGTFHKFGEGFQAETQMSNLMRFGSNKLNPVWKFAYDMASSSQYNPFHVYDRSAQLAIPLYVQDVIGVVRDNPELIPWLGPMAFGIGAQTYSKGESVGKLIAPENDWLATGGGPADLGPDELNPSMEY